MVLVCAQSAALQAAQAMQEPFVLFCFLSEASFFYWLVNKVNLFFGCENKNDYIYHQSMILVGLVSPS